MLLCLLAQIVHQNNTKVECEGHWHYMDVYENHTMQKNIHDGYTN